jgi:hypothetical protein
MSVLSSDSGLPRHIRVSTLNLLECNKDHEVGVRRVVRFLASSHAVNENSSHHAAFAPTPPSGKVLLFIAPLSLFSCYPFIKLLRSHEKLRTSTVSRLPAKILLWANKAEIFLMYAVATKDEDSIGNPSGSRYLVFELAEIQNIPQRLETQIMITTPWHSYHHLP